MISSLPMETAIASQTIIQKAAADILVRMDFNLLCIVIEVVAGEISADGGRVALKENV